MSKYNKIQHSGDSPYNTKNVLIWLLVIIVLFSSIYFMIQSFNSQTYDSRYCPKKDKENFGTTAILVDLSDPMQASQEEALKKELTNLTTTVDGLKVLNKGDRLAIYLTSSDDVPEKIFDLCNPGSEDERNTNTEGKIIYEQKWKNFFKSVQTELNKKFNNTDNINQSPIIESIAYVRNKEFNPPNVLGESSKIHDRNNIIVVSDMLQNSNLYSVYKEKKSYAEVLASKPMNLAHINYYHFVVINPKYKKYQTPALIEWWRNFIIKAKGRNKKVRYL